MGTFAHIKDKGFCKGKETVIHWGLFSVVGKIEPWVIVPDFVSVSAYVRRHILNKEIFSLWYCLAYLWMQMNEEQLG